MKIFTCFLVSLILFTSSFSFINSQVMDSKYVRENVVEVLGVETEENEVVEEKPESFFNRGRVVDVFAVSGGVVLVILFAYIAYARKEGK